MNTAKTLQEAAEQAVSFLKPSTLVTDSGIENISGEVDKLIGSGLFSRVLALKEVSFSNSLIEAWWRSLKHQWLYLNTLDTEATLLRLVDFYVKAHNTAVSRHKLNNLVRISGIREGVSIPDGMSGRRARTWSCMGRKASP